MGPDGPAGLALLKELGPRNADAPEVAAKLLGQVLGVDRDPVLGEDVAVRVRARLRGLPPRERLDDVGTQVPVARVVRLFSSR
jgi:hypothetical protein